MKQSLTHNQGVTETCDLRVQDVRTPTFEYFISLTARTGQDRHHGTGQTTHWLLAQESQHTSPPTMKTRNNHENTKANNANQKKNKWNNTTHTNLNAHDCEDLKDTTNTTTQQTHNTKQHNKHNTKQQKQQKQRLLLHVVHLRLRRQGGPPCYLCQIRWSSKL